MVVKPESIASLSLHHLSDTMLLRALTVSSPSWLVHVEILQSLVSPISGLGAGFVCQRDWNIGDLDLVP